MKNPKGIAAKSQDARSVRLHEDRYQTKKKLEQIAHEFKRDERYVAENVLEGEESKRAIAKLRAEMQAHPPYQKAKADFDKAEKAYRANAEKKKGGHTGQPLMRGKKGGMYYLGKSGKKIYAGKSAA